MLRKSRKRKQKVRTYVTRQNKWLLSQETAQNLNYLMGMSELIKHENSTILVMWHRRGTKIVIDDFQKFRRFKRYENIVRNCVLKRYAIPKLRHGCER